MGIPTSGANSVVEKTKDGKGRNIIIQSNYNSMNSQSQASTVRNKNPKDSTHGLFNGSMFVTFATQGDASKFLESEAKFREKYDLKKMTKQAYCFRFLKNRKKIF